MNWKLYCAADYSGKGNQQPGGWSFALVGADSNHVYSGGDIRTTERRMLYTGLLNGLKEAKMQGIRRIDVYPASDWLLVSRYCNAYTLDQWRRNGWRHTATGVQVLNHDLLDEIRKAIKGMTINYPQHREEDEKWLNAVTARATQEQQEFQRARESGLQLAEARKS